MSAQLVTLGPLGGMPIFASSIGFKIIPPNPTFSLTSFKVTCGGHVGSGWAWLQSSCGHTDMTSGMSPGHGSSRHAVIQTWRQAWLQGMAPVVIRSYGHGVTLAPAAMRASQGMAPHWLPWPCGLGFPSSSGMASHKSIHVFLFARHQGAGGMGCAYYMGVLLCHSTQLVIYSCVHDLAGRCSSGTCMRRERSRAGSRPTRCLDSPLFSLTPYHSPIWRMIKTMMTNKSKWASSLEKEASSLASLTRWKGSPGLPDHSLAPLCESNLGFLPP